MYSGLMAWYTGILNFLMGILSQGGYFLSVQFLNLAVFWQLLPIYTGWFAIQFITKGQEGEEIADRFMNGFSLLWVGFELGSYLIDNFVLSISMVIKLITVIFLFIYAIFIMRLTLLNKDISKYLARIGEVSAINIAAMLFIQDLVVVTNPIKLIQFIIAFVLFYFLLDLLIKQIVNQIYKRTKLPIAEEPAKAPEEPPKPPRYERLTEAKPPVKPPVVRPPQTRPPQQVRRPPVTRSPPTQVRRPATPPAARPPARPKKPGEEETT